MVSQLVTSKHEVELRHRGSSLKFVRASALIVCSFTKYQVAQIRSFYCAFQSA